MRAFFDAVRSVFFNLAFYLFSIVFLGTVVVTLALFGNEKQTRQGVYAYCSGALWIARWVMGIKTEFRGTDGLPKDEALILAAAHQSNADPMMTCLIRRDVTALAKKELFKMPAVGRILRAMRVIEIDRQSGKAHQEMQNVGARMRSENRLLIVYPQATRVKPGDRRRLKSGAYHLARDTGLPVYTASTNTGLFWRRGFFHRSGTMVFEVKPFDVSADDKETFMRALRDRVVGDSEALIREAGYGSLLPAEKTERSS